MRGLAGLRDGEDAGQGDGREDRVDDVRQLPGDRTPLGEHTGDACTEAETGGVRHRGTLGAGAGPGVRVEGCDGEFLDPGTAGGHDDADADTGEDATDEDRPLGGLTGGDEDAAEQGDQRGREHDEFASVAVGQRAGEEQCGDDADSVGDQEGVDEDVAEDRFLAVEDEHRGGFVAAPGDGEDGESDDEPRAAAPGACGSPVLCRIVRLLLFSHEVHRRPPPHL